MRIVIVGTDTLYSSILSQRLIESGEVVGITLTTAVFPGRGALAAVLHALRRYSVRFFAYKLLETLIFRGLAMSGRGRPGIVTMARRRDIPVLRTGALNSDASVSWISALEPELIVSINASERFGRRLRNTPAHGCLNIHASPLPRYRGLAPYFWVLLHGETETAISVHIVDSGLDTGGIIVSRSVPVRPGDSAQSLFLRCCVVGADALDEALEQIRAGSARTVSQDGPPSYFSWPTKAAMREFTRRGHRLWHVCDFVKVVTDRESRDLGPSPSER